MIQVSGQAYGAICGLIGIILAAGWAAYGPLGGGTVFLAVMVVASMLLAGGAAVLCSLEQCFWQLCFSLGIASLLHRKGSGQAQEAPKQAILVGS